MSESVISYLESYMSAKLHVSILLTTKLSSPQYGYQLTAARASTYLEQKTVALMSAVLERSVGFA
jgi:hypothetical protein